MDRTVRCCHTLDGSVKDEGKDNAQESRVYPSKIITTRVDGDDDDVEEEESL